MGRLTDFEVRWNQAITRWEQRATPLRGVVVVVHHRQWPYLEAWLGLRRVGELEPKPGIPPMPGYLADLKARLKNTPAKAILHAAYVDPAPARWLSRQTGIPEITLPFHGGGHEAGQ